MVDKQVPVKVDEKLKAQFEWACAKADTTTSQQLRKHMRNFVTQVFDKLTSTITLDGSNPDSITDITYAPDHPDDVKTVKRMIWLTREFENLHPGVRLLPYKAREEMKQTAHPRIRDESLPLEDRVNAYVTVMRSHFMRSASSFLDRDNPLSHTIHPGFDEYARHYVKADTLRQDRKLNKDLVDALLERFPLEGPSCMTPGSSYWGR